MAINAFEISPLGQKYVPLNLANAIRDGNSSADTVSRRCRLKKKVSPYLHNEKIQMTSRITEKRFVQKRDEMFSSFPLAANIYKANSDEFKTKKTKLKHKNKKSVLTLPNGDTFQTGTVSDMNGSEYFQLENSQKSKQKKRTSNKKRKLCTQRRGGFEIIDRDAHYGLDDSTTDFLGKKRRDVELGNGMCADNMNFGAQDVWTVLRNINKFQFRPSVKFSDESLGTPSKKKTTTTKRTKNMGKGRRLIETCRTQEFSYVANIEIQQASKTTISPNSSFDRITVINKDDVSHLQAIENNNKCLARTSPRNKNSSQGEKIVSKNLAICSPKVIQHKNPKTWNNPPKNNKNVMHVNEKPLPSFSTINESQDSSNYYRRGIESPVSYVSSTKPLTHPNEIKEIVLNKPRANLNLENKINRKEQPKTPSKLKNCYLKIPSTTDIQKPKQQLVKAMPSSSMLTNFSTNEIKKKINQLKFPLTILGKDQVSSTIEVFDYEPPQFYGLDKQIWPFMVEWDANYTVKQKRFSPIERIANHLRKINDDLSLVKAKERKGPMGDVIIIPKKKTERRAFQNPIQVTPQETPPTQTFNKKTKPIRQLKDKMLKLLYKKPATPESLSRENFFKRESKETLKIDASTEMVKELEKKIEIKVPLTQPLAVPKKITDIHSIFQKSEGQLECNLPPWKQTVPKAKWSSDFIENIIKKIKSGAYYIIEDQKKLYPPNSKNVMEKRHKIQNMQTNNVRLTEKEIQKQGLKDMSIQTALFNCPDEASPGSTVSCNGAAEWNVTDPLLKIPGFDDPVPNLEIRSLGVNKISVRNLQANVTVHFDVSVPSSRQSSITHINDRNSNASSCCIPLTAKMGQSKIYKCSTTLINAVLPAELCTVLPMIMHNVMIDSTTTSTSSRTDSRATLSELNESDLLSYFKPDINHFNPYTAFSKPNIYNQITTPYKSRMVLPVQSPTNFPQNFWKLAQDPWRAHFPQYLHMSREMIAIFGGRFSIVSMKLRSWKLFCNVPSVFTRFSAIRKVSLQENLRLPKPLVQRFMYVIVDPRDFLLPEPGYPNPTRINSLVPLSVNDNTSLVPYKEKTQSYFGDLLYKMWNYCKFNIHLNIPHVLSFTLLNTLTLNIEVQQHKISETISCIITNLPNKTEEHSENNIVCNKVKNEVIKINQRCISPPEKQNLSLLPSKKNINDEKSLVLRDEKSLVLRETKPEKVKIRRSNYAKCFSKCKSATNVDKLLCTPLSKIVSLEDFMQALGSKTLASVFSDTTAQKVMTCVGEMKNWIKEITPGQALLILLLLNKKDTQHLIQFRPVLLQGIAVHRITRAAELDMEIEVIEKENVTVNQYDGISYMTSSKINKDMLFEELCWIAKTTASDYQKPFDECQEKLLKSLLQKRKPLNPSYLRVVARYVGLGLLKTPGKN